MGGFGKLREVEFTEVPVRAILATLFSVGITVGFFLGVVESKDYKEIVMLALVWYFTKRNEGDQLSQATGTGAVGSGSNQGTGSGQPAVVSVPLATGDAEVNMRANVEPAGTAVTSLSANGGVSRSVRE